MKNIHDAISNEVNEHFRKIYCLMILHYKSLVVSNLRKFVRENVRELELFEANLICHSIKWESPSSDLIMLFLISVFNVSDIYLTI